MEERHDSLAPIRKEEPKVQEVKIIEEQEKIHIVKAGDTLAKIAKKYNTTITALKLKNNLTKNYVFIGQELKI